MRGAPRVSRPDPSGADPRISSLRLELAQEAARLGYWDYEVGTERLVWDEACASMFGITLDEFEGTLEAFDARCHPDDLPQVRAVLAATGPADAMETTFRALQPDGSARHLLSRGRGVAGDDGGLERIVGVVLDVTSLHIGAERLSGLARVALALAGAEDDESLTRVVIEHGAAVLGADGGAVCVRDDERGVIRLAMTDSLGEEVQLEFGELPLDGPLPGCWTARTGAAVYLPDRDAGLAFTPAMQVVYDGTDRDAWAVLPLRSGERLLGSLVVSWAEPRDFPPEERELLAAFAAQTAQALDRVQVLQAERRQAEDARRLSETLQRSLLTSPPQPDSLQVAVRYAPAAQTAAVGGDWYDAFVVPDGALTLVIGDCVGHDRQAAAAMATMRNLLRATAYAVEEPPAAVLAALERAMRGLEVDVLATALLARVEQGEDLRAQHLRTVRWSSAGHLPPVLLHPDGRVEVLEREPDLLLGSGVESTRTDATVDVAEGSTLVLYTDGLVERRGEDLDVGIGRLRDLVARLAHLPLERLCDELLGGLVGDDAEDDVALLAVRFGAQPGGGGARAGATAGEPLSVGSGVPALERSVSLPPEPTSARAARRFVAEALQDAGWSDRADAAQLAVSEVVTNAFLHAHTAVTLSVAAVGDTLLVEVRDDDPAMPSPRGYDEQATTGRGMSLVAAVTSGHGVRSLGDAGKVVWFTLGPDAEEEADAPLAWETDDTGRAVRGGGGAVLLGVPATLWRAARQHHDALVRELTLRRAAHGRPDEGWVRADAAHRALSDAVEEAVAAAASGGAAHAALPEGHPSPLPVAPRVDAVVPAGLDAAAYAGLQDLLDEAEALAARGELLVRPGLPEVIAVRDWACEQVIAQLGGTPASPWPGTDSERFTEAAPDDVAPVPDWDAATVAAADRGAVAADDSNRILAVSPPLCAALGFRAEELVGRRVVALVPHRFREAHVAGFTRHLTTGEAHAVGVDLVLPVLRADGSEVDCRFLIEATGTPSGRTVYTAWITPLS
jgi:PAS domain S-box-containing protein